MKKKILFSITALLLLGFASCKKDKDGVSRVVTASWPTVTFANNSITGHSSSTDQYYLSNITSDNTLFVTLPVGANVSLTPTAFDSILKESIPVEIIRDGHLNTSVPGLYVYDFKTGFNSSGTGAIVRYYIGVTDEDGSDDLSGEYVGVVGPGADTVDGITIDPVSTAMYLVSDPVANRSQIGAVFVQTSPTTISLGSQPTDLGQQSFGDIQGTDGTISIVDSAHIISYKLINDVINADYPANTTFTLIQQ